MTGRVIVSAVIAGVATAISAVSVKPFLVGYHRVDVPHRADNTSNNMWKRVGDPLVVPKTLMPSEKDATLAFDNHQR